MAKSALNGSVAAVVRTAVAAAIVGLTASAWHNHGRLAAVEQSGVAVRDSLQRIEANIDKLIERHMED